MLGLVQGFGCVAVDEGGRVARQTGRAAVDEGGMVARKTGRAAVDEGAGLHTRQGVLLLWNSWHRVP